MNLYVFEYVPNMSDSYHSSGGCVVIAESLEQAKSMLPYADHEANGYWDENDEYISEVDESAVATRNNNLDYKVYYLVNNLYKQRLYSFPNAGCC